MSLVSFFASQTPKSTLGVALQFQNYELKPKDMKSCDQGWWKVNELMYVCARWNITTL